MNLAAKLSYDDTGLRSPAESIHFISMLTGTGRSIDSVGLSQLSPRPSLTTTTSSSSKFKYMGLYNIPEKFNAAQQHMDDEIPDEDMADRPEEWDASQMSLGEILAQTHRHVGSRDDLILAELPYTLQGITTQLFPWMTALKPAEPGASTITVGIPDTLIWPNIGLVNQLLEPALLFKDIKAQMQVREAKGRKPGGRSVGLVEQALYSAIEEELQGYLTLVGVVESEIRRQQQSSAVVDRNTPKRITIRRCIILLQEATLGLRLIHSILQESEGLVGGQILSLMHGYTFNGDDMVSKFAKRLLPKISTPFYDILNQWIGCGQLVDPHDEFFVRPGNEDSMWQDRFLLENKKVPSYMGREVSEKVFQIGKTLYFVRVACDDQDWVEERQAVAIAALQGKGRTNSIEELEKLVSEAYIEVVKHLNEILRSRFGLDAHLKGLKDYLLLGKGDFVQLLVESVAPSLDKPAVQLFRHHLTATLETAIRGSNAQYDSDDVLRSLDARMLELGHGDIGWDVFTLDYRVEQPLDTVILDRVSMTEYLRVFNFLWRIKRVSYALNRTWRRMATSERAGTLQISLPVDSYGRSIATDDQEWKQALRIVAFVEAQWKLVRAVCGEMLHFIGELQYYINYEVVEMSWVQLQRDLNGAGSNPYQEAASETTAPVLSVDEIIGAHKRYLKQITYKGLLGGGDELMGDLHEILKAILVFITCVDGLHEVTGRLRTALAGGTGLPGQDEKRAQNIGTMITDLKSKFEKSVERLVDQLGRQEDGEMRFLGVRLDFNGFYSRLSEKPKVGN